MWSLPAVMLFSGREAITLSSMGEIYFRWSYISIVSEFFFGFIFFNRGHHGPELIHQNDEIKSFDFGEFQISTTIDRVEANYNIFTSLAYFGHQTLHHLFPTIDAAVLPQLEDTLMKTCKEFDVDLHGETSMLRATVGQFKQLYRSETVKCS